MAIKPKAFSLHIGLNSVNPSQYAGWSGPLNACENDAHDLHALATDAGFTSKVLLTSKATHTAVVANITALAKKLVAGDIFLLTYSGHGGQVPDKNGDEPDGLDETWCLFDRQMVDDELHALWKKFVPDVRVVVLSDSCHSGTITRMALDRNDTRLTRHGSHSNSSPYYIPRAMPAELLDRAYRVHKEDYDKVKVISENDISASVLLISGCQDPQTSMDGPFNGAFTGALLRVWNHGKFKGDYRTLHKKIQRILPDTQQPNLVTLGTGKSFVTQRPFQP